jgi:hypothetical protein
MVREYFDAANLNGAMADERLSMMVMRSGNLSVGQYFLQKCKSMFG